MGNILAVDPGFSSYGCAVFNGKQEVIKIALLETEKSKSKRVRVSDDDAYRVQKLATELKNLIIENDIKGVVGELPISGGQSEKAVKCMAYAASVSNAVFAVMNLPVEWVSPVEIKKVVTGLRTASKDDMMKAICKLHGWKITERIVNSKTGKKAKVYWPLEEKWAGSNFEHVADALGAFEALKHCNIIKMFTDKGLSF